MCVQLPYSSQSAIKQQLEGGVCVMKLEEEEGRWNMCEARGAEGKKKKETDKVCSTQTPEYYFVIPPV